MNKKVNITNILLIVNLILSVTAIGLSIGSFIVGVNNNEQGVIANDIFQTDTYNNFYGVYKNQYLNQYNISIDSYIVLRENGECRFTEVRTENASKVNFAAAEEKYSQKCSYSYDENKKTGDIKTWYTNYESGEEYNIEHRSFSYNGGSLTVGGTVYYKTQAAY